MHQPYDENHGETIAISVVKDVYDLSRHEVKSKELFHLPLSTCAQKLVQDVAEKFSYNADTFELVYQRQSDNESVIIDIDTSVTLEELGFLAKENGRNNLIIASKSSGCPKTAEGEPSGVTSNPNQRYRRSTKFDVVNRGQLDSGDHDSTHVPPPAPPPPYALFGPSDNLYSTAVLRGDTGFVGLVNQAMTCYLNSLLQTLYMTPEFRNALYRWDFDGTEEESAKSIPFQLQRLFLLLQTSRKPAVGTTDLTTSFGWDSSEAWQQHDVQELCRVMFDALEQKFKKTEQADLINTLYEGKMKDYVKCLECGNESAREDTFLDVPLVVRPFGSNQAYSCVEDALRAFVTPETLEGSNQYFCEHCNKKCDAHKGLKFIKFPYLLTLQLKRFDFDPQTMHRIKLNDKVTFPEILDLNEFVKVEAKDEGFDSDYSESGESAAVNDSHAAPSGSSSDQERSDITGGDADSKGGIEDCQANSTGECNEINLQRLLLRGEKVYELFSIMVHSGSANGGHYYAYIKSFTDGKWYCFNDAQVSSLTVDDIQKTYGGGPSRAYYSSAYSSSTNAYMLMYRRIDPVRNAKAMTVEEFPAHIKSTLQNMRKREEKERQEREMDRYMCKIKLYCHHPIQNRMMDMRLKVHRDCTLAEATVTAHKIMDLENVVAINCCRLIKYDEFHDSFESSFDESDSEKTMGELLGGVKSSYTFDLLLEIKTPNEEFQEYKPGGATVKMHIVDLSKEEVATTPITIRSSLSETVEAFKSQVARTFGISASCLRIVLDGYNKEPELLGNPENLLSSEGFGKSNKVYIEFQDQEDSKLPFKSSKLSKILESYSHIISILISLPEVDKSIREKFNEWNGCIDRDPLSVTEDDNKVQKVDRPDLVKESIGHFPLKKVSCQKVCSDEISNLEVIASAPSNSPELWKDIARGAMSTEPESVRKNPCMLLPDDSSLDCDEGLGDSEIGDTCLSKSQKSYQAVHSDQSEDSSLTDSERTLIGDAISPQNLSPDVVKMISDVEGEAMPPHLESPYSSVIQPESDSAHSSSESNFQIDEPNDDVTNPSSPEENAKDMKFFKFYNEPKNTSQPEEEKSEYRRLVNRYFKACPYTDTETGEKMLRVHVDKRITFYLLKKELEPYVEVSSNCFKLYRLYSSSQALECHKQSETLEIFSDDLRLTVKLERPLRKGECKVKIFQLCINNSEPFKHLLDCIFAKGSTVLSAKKELLSDLKSNLSLEVPLNRCRLRKKSWKNPGTVFMDHQLLDKDIIMTSNWEVFLEILDDAEPVTSSTQVAVFTRRWHPSTYELDPFQEIVLDDTSVDGLKSKLSEISSIPKDSIEFCKGQGTFPFEISLLSIHKELDWQSKKCTWSLNVLEDGFVVYYRDEREELKKLSEDERWEIMNRENVKSNKMHKTTFSPRKEKALKIYTLDDTPTKISSSCVIDSNKIIVPDLD